jgi:hypothetical protein
MADINGDYNHSRNVSVKLGHCRVFLSGCCPVYNPIIDFTGWVMTIEFKWSHFERDVILWGVRWYVAYPISYRQSATVRSRK